MKLKMREKPSSLHVRTWILMYMAKGTVKDATKLLPEKVVIAVTSGAQRYWLIALF